MTKFYIPEFAILTVIKFYKNKYINLLYLIVYLFKMKTSLFALVFAGLITFNTEAINLETLDQLSTKALDGPTNGEMAEDEKDTLI